MIQHEESTAVICTICGINEFLDSNVATSRMLLASAKQAGWKRRVVKRHAYGHLWRDTEDICPTCQVKEANKEESK